MDIKDQSWFSIFERYNLNSNICLYGIVTEDVSVDQYDIYKDAQLIGFTQRLFYRDEEAFRGAVYCVAAKYENGCESEQICIEIMPCNPPYNLQVSFGEFSEEGAKLTWETLLGEGIFNIYRDGALIVEEYAKMEYVDYDIEPDTEYTWSVTTVCKEGETTPTLISGLTPKKKEGIAESEGYTMIIFPNPTSGELRIKNEKLKIKNVRLFDIFGRQLLETVDTNININHLPAGIFFMQIETEQRIITKKIVKQ